MATYTYRCDETDEDFIVEQEFGSGVTYKTFGEVPKDAFLTISEELREHAEANPDAKIIRIITGGGGFKIDGKFSSMSGGNNKADLKDHIQEVKKQGKEDAQKSRDMSMPKSK
jgi:hypothetical protein